MWRKQARAPVQRNVDASTLELAARPLRPGLCPSPTPMRPHRHAQSSYVQPLIFDADIFRLPPPTFVLGNVGDIFYSPTATKTCRTAAPSELEPTFESTKYVRSLWLMITYA
jgi:hypothetical protein